MDRSHTSSIADSSSRRNSTAHAKRSSGSSARTPGKRTPRTTTEVLGRHGAPLQHGRPCQVEGLRHATNLMAAAARAPNVRRAHFPAPPPLQLHQFVSDRLKASPRCTHVQPGQGSTISCANKDATGRYQRPQRQSMCCRHSDAPGCEPLDGCKATTRARTVFPRTNQQRPRRQGNKAVAHAVPPGGGAAVTPPLQDEADPPRARPQHAHVSPSREPTSSCDDKDATGRKPRRWP